MSRLIDTNVLLRVMLNDTPHPKYDTCVGILQAGGVVTPVVAAEVAFNIRAVYKQGVARSIAESKGELLEFCKAPKVYALTCRDYPAGWNKSMCEVLYNDWNRILSEYPLVQIANRTVFDCALGLGKQFGLDWVDCYLLALEQHSANAHTVCTVDAKLLSCRESIMTARTEESDSGCKELNLTGAGQSI